jgi:hypothetical protein
VTFEEVGQALYAPPGLRYERRVDDHLLLIAGMAHSRRVIVVTCDAEAYPSTYKIIAARPLTDTELDEWRKEVL